MYSLCYKVCDRSGVSAAQGMGVITDQEVIQLVGSDPLFADEMAGSPPDLTAGFDCRI